MKQILIPYDFSESTKNVLNYGIGLSKELQADLVLMHVMAYPVVTPETGLPAFSYQDIQADSLKELKKVAEKLKQSDPELGSINCFTDMGDVTESIVSFCKKHPIEFVVMGISQHNNKLLQVLMGSNAVETAHKTKCTVIIVPPETSYHSPKHIAFASNDSQNTQDPALTKARDISRLFRADLQVLQVVPENHHFAPADVIMNNYFEGTPQSPEHKLFIITEKKVSEGLLGMLRNKLIDMIVMEPKEHGIFHKLFHESVSKEVAFSSPVPVALVHG